MGFRFKRSVCVDYDRQGYIYFTSRLYTILPGAEKTRILNTCMAAGGEHYKALFEFVTTDAGATAVCARHYLSRSTLERIVRRYYELFDTEL